MMLVIYRIVLMDEHLVLDSLRGSLAVSTNY